MSYLVFLAPPFVELSLDFNFMLLFIAYSLLFLINNIGSPTVQITQSKNPFSQNVIDKTPPVIEITRVNSNDQLRTSTCIGAKTGTGSAHCHLYIRKSANWAYSTDRKYTDGSGSGINYNRDEYYWDAPGGVGGNQCPFWFIPKVEYNGDYTKCGGTSWKACIRAKMCPNLHEVIQKERIWDNAGNVSGELMIHILLDNYPCTR